MRLSICCETCGGAEVLATESDDPRVLMTLMLACHAVAGGHTSPHRLVPKVNGGDVPAGDVSFRAVCIAGNCNQQPLEVAARIPREYVPAMALSFHSHHEGHRHRIEIDGKTFFESPLPPG